MIDQKRRVKKLRTKKIVRGIFEFAVLSAAISFWVLLLADTVWWGM